MPVHTGRPHKATAAAAGAAAAGGFGGHAHPAAAPQERSRSVPSPAAARKGRLTPEAAATRIQTEWRKARLVRHRPALHQLAAANSQLLKLTQQLHEVQQQQQGKPLTQKQYLELSELVMRVLLSLDATSCGAAELRAKRKELTLKANRLLDEIQAAQKAESAAAAPENTARSIALPQQQPTQQQQQSKKPGKSWFRR